MTFAEILILDPNSIREASGSWLLSDDSHDGSMIFDPFQLVVFNSRQFGTRCRTAQAKSTACAHS